MPGRTQAQVAGRPPVTSRADLTLVAMQLFLAQGFEQTTVDQIAAAAGVSRRTFFRYFQTKAAVLWSEFERDTDAVRSLLAAADPDEPMTTAIRKAVVGAYRYAREDLPQLRARMTLVATVPSLQAAATVRFEAWERAVGEFAAARLGLAENSLYPQAIGKSTLAACRAAYDVWADDGDRELVSYLDDALRALEGGFDEVALRRRSRRGRSKRLPAAPPAR